MKKSLINFLIAGAAFTLTGAGVADAQPAQPAPARQDLRNNNFRHDRSPGRAHFSDHNRHISYSYRPYAVFPYRSPYRYGYSAWPYYTVGYWPYYGNYGYFGYYPGVSVNYTTYSDANSPGYAVGGAVLGGVLGGIIGNNSGRGNTWAGAAIGSTVGFLAGNAADNAAVRQQRAERDAAQAAANNAEIARTMHVAQPETPPPQQPRRVAEPAAPTPMSQANALFGRQ